MLLRDAGEHPAQDLPTPSAARSLSKPTRLCPRSTHATSQHALSSPGFEARTPQEQQQRPRPLPPVLSCLA